jgi:hypothetical protein
MLAPANFTAHLHSVKEALLPQAFFELSLEGNLN